MLASFHCFYHSPLGWLDIRHDGRRLRQLIWYDGATPGDAEAADEGHPLSRQIFTWLDGYFAGGNPGVDFELAPDGTEFQKKVWQRMMAIPPGETVSYGDVAGELASSARAVGGACRRNPLVLVVPCHRIVAASHLGGYAGATEGVMFDRKKALLALEQSAGAFTL